MLLEGVSTGKVACESLCGSLYIFGSGVEESTAIETGITDCEKTLGVDATPVAGPSAVVGEALLEVLVLRNAIEHHQLITFLR